MLLALAFLGPLAFVALAGVAARATAAPSATPPIGVPRWTVALSGALLFSLACKGADPVALPTVSAIALAPGDSTLWIGQTLQLRITVRDNEGQSMSSSGVTWSTSNSGVATVTPGGQVTGVGDGSVTITARAGAVSGQAVLLVRLRPDGVVSVRIDVTKTQYELADTAAFAATPLDADKQPLLNRTVTWSSGNADVVSILPTGFFTAVTPGTAVVTATSDGVKAQATITVVPQSGPVVQWPHEPPGSVMITERSFGALTEDRWGPGSAAFSIQDDNSAPKSPSGIGQMRFPAGFSSGGISPTTLERGLSNTATTIYVSYWMKLSANWVGHSSGVNKVLHFWVAGVNRLITSATGAGTEPLLPQLRLQNAVNYGREANLSPNLVPTMRIVRGRWQRIELVLKTNSPGVADGTFEWWIDGVRIAYYTGVQLTNGAGTWELLQWSPTWGGVGGPNVPADQTMSIDHIYISGK